MHALTGRPGSPKPHFFIQDHGITGPFGLLPHELIVKIFSNLPPKDVVQSLGAVCWSLHWISEDDAIWKPLVQNHFLHYEPDGTYCHLFKEMAILEQNARIGNFHRQTLLENKSRVLCFALDEGRLYVSSFDASGNTIQVWNKDTGEHIQTLSGHRANVKCLHIAGQFLYTGSADSTIWIWNKKTGILLQQLTGHRDMVLCIQVEGSSVFSGSADGKIKIWNRLEGDCRITLTEHEGAVSCLLIIGEHLYSGSADGTIKVWHKVSGRCIKTIVGHQGTVSRLQVVGNLLYSASEDGTIKVWDIKNEKHLHTIPAHQRPISFFQIVGNCLFTVSDDLTIKIWDLEGNCLQTLEGHHDKISGFQIDGKCIYTGSWDKSIHVWDFGLPRPQLPSQEPSQYEYDSDLSLPQMHERLDYECFCSLQ